MFSQMHLTIIFLSLVACVVGSASHSPGQRTKAPGQRGIIMPLTRNLNRKAQPQGKNGQLYGNVSIVNSHEYTYLVTMSVGGQEFSLALDTGSSDLWVVSTDCQESDCQDVSRYTRSSSSSLKMTDQPFKLTYLLGSVVGSVAFDNVSLGQYDISSQAFGLGNETQSLSLSTNGNSGILGLAFPLSASIAPTTGRTFLENIFSNFDDHDRFFAFKLGRNHTQNQMQNSNSSGNAVSSFTIGQLDPAIADDTSDFQYTPVISIGQPLTYDYWKLPLRGITINSTPLHLSPSLMPKSHTPVAALDTGTTLILGPTIDVAAFWARVGTDGTVRKNPSTGFWEVKCNRAVTVGFNLGEENGSKEYIVHPGDISWGESRSSDGWCMGGVQANDGVNSADWLLGDAFLRNVYVTHHGATSTQPPLIGLLNTTDPTIAMAEFVQERGQDSAPPPPSQEELGTHPSPMIKLLIINGLCLLVGFVGGVIGTSLFRAGRARKNRAIKL